VPLLFDCPGAGWAAADKELVERFIVPGGDPKRLGTWLLVEMGCGLIHSLTPANGDQTGGTWCATQ
jgi:hypothetical protein